MRIAHVLGATALTGAALLAPGTASAQTSIESLGLTVTVTPAVVSDYLFRGISQTRGGPAVQGAIDVEHASGFYIGGFVSNVAWPTQTPEVDIRQEVDLAAGYRFEVAGVKLDAGFTYFGYPGYTRPPGGFDWAWYELSLRASYEIAPLKLVGQVAWSPNFNYESGSAVYIEGGFDLALDLGFTAAVRAGYQWVEDNARWGAPDYAVFSFGLSRELAFGVTGGITLTHTTLRNGSADCFLGLTICGTRFVASLSRPF